MNDSTLYDATIEHRHLTIAKDSDGSYYYKAAEPSRFDRESQPKPEADDEYVTYEVPKEGHVKTVQELDQALILSGFGIDSIAAVYRKLLGRDRHFDLLARRYCCLSR